MKKLLSNIVGMPLIVLQIISYLKFKDTRITMKTV